MLLLLCILSLNSLSRSRLRASNLAALKFESVILLLLFPCLSSVSLGADGEACLAHTRADVVISGDLLLEEEGMLNGVDFFLDGDGDLLGLSSTIEGGE